MSIRDLSSVALLDAVLQRDITPEQAVDEMERRDHAANGLGRARVGAITTIAVLVIAVICIALGGTWAGLMFAMLASTPASDAVRNWRAWRAAVKPEETHG